jgi:hypothetical protein
MQNTVSTWITLIHETSTVELSETDRARRGYLVVCYNYSGNAVQKTQALQAEMQ